MIKTKEMMEAIIRRPGFKWDEIENLKWLDTRQAAFYIGKSKKYLDWMCTKKLIAYNTVAGKREFDIEVHQGIGPFGGTLSSHLHPLFSQIFLK